LIPMVGFLPLQLAGGGTDLGRPAEFSRGPGAMAKHRPSEDRPRLAQALDRLQTSQSTSEEEEYRVSCLTARSGGARQS